MDHPTQNDILIVRKILPGLWQDTDKVDPAAFKSWSAGQKYDEAPIQLYYIPEGSLNQIQYARLLEEIRGITADTYVRIVTMSPPTYVMMTGDKEVKTPILYDVIARGSYEIKLESSLNKSVLGTTRRDSVYACLKEVGPPKRETSAAAPSATMSPRFPASAF